MFALVDCNNFYASCERVFNPNLREKPVAILSNNDGCVISMSDEAKTLQLPFGAPIFKWEGFCKANNIKVLSSNYPLYGDMSSRVMSILQQYTPDVEVYSIDEAFLEFKGFDTYNFNDYGSQIRHRILKWTGIPTCVGVAPTKALSKVANKIARKFPNETKGVYVIDSEEKRIKALKWIKLQDVWGIGRGLQKRLALKNCKTAFDFVQLSDEWVRKNFSITEWKLKKDLEGIPTLKLDEIKTKRAIATTRSFEYTFSDIDNIKERVSTFATSCAEKLRKQESSCHMIIVILSSDRHKKELEQHRASRVVKLSYPTDSTLTICKYAVETVTSIFKEGIKYKRAGVIVTGLVPNNNHQLHLFEHENPKHKSLMTAIDSINKRYKDYKIKLGNQDLERTWKMRQERLSPRYTTDINEIIKVR
ncbi:Y-family DNA polymerase [Flavobacteriaceae bacterium S0825]|uniref:Y-family DNA polymerase n=1 Tax=Gaetbulibacter sp. S0825 TaxID=2720084 RepID=UPI00143193CD|nr:Y-family DNA polymerase [Gaetbulibacter sp. S0825]MCK0108093.1 Y-family DNA polymerase [Flavobacteriaceae bacterium S0825]NIX63729.1 Y-family DNA polymerase [Gaetbulibacter sp. S0825]